MCQSSFKCPGRFASSIYSTSSFNFSSFIAHLLISSLYPSTFCPSPFLSHFLWLDSSLVFSCIEKMLVVTNHQSSSKVETLLKSKSIMFQDYSKIWNWFFLFLVETIYETIDSKRIVQFIVCCFRWKRSTVFLIVCLKREDL